MHAPRGAISGLTGFQASAGGTALRWTRQPTDVYAFDIDVPEGAKTIDVAFDFLSPTRTSEGRIVVTPAMMNLHWEQVSLRSEEHTSELQSLMRISYAVFCLKNNQNNQAIQQ